MNAPFIVKKGIGRKIVLSWKKKGQSDKGKTIVIAEFDNSDWSLALSASTNSSSVCILDLGGIYHMCPYREFFYDFKELEEDVVYITNDSPITTHGVVQFN